LSFIVAAMTGCAAPKPPELVEAPDPPEEWKIVAERNFGCPDTNGEFESTPTVAVLQNDSSWKVSIGKSYDFALLLPFSRVKGVKQIPDKASSLWFIKGYSFESDPQGDTLRIIHQLYNSESYVTHILKKANQDYRCEAGTLVFPEFVKQGGTEGATLSGRIHRQATKTSSGDLLFYEQVRSHKTVHTYYLFKSMDS